MILDHETYLKTLHRKSLECSSRCSVTLTASNLATRYQHMSRHLDFLASMIVVLPDRKLKQIYRRMSKLMKTFCTKLDDTLS